MHAAVRHYMTPCPRTIEADESLFRARQRMQAVAIRHLPVMEKGELIGVITERDIRMLECAGRSPLDIKVREAMTPEPFAVDQEAPLAQVAETMAQRKLGSAIVLADGKVAGIFSSIDALRTLAEIFDEYFSAPTSDRYGAIVSGGGHRC
jgi:acetoin utilization protein AcuB